MSESGERHLAAVGRRDVDLLERIGVLPVAGIHFHDHVVLVEERVGDRHLALTEGVIEGVVDHLRGDAEPAGGWSVDH